MIRRNELRVWAVYDNAIGRIEYLSESRFDCDRILKMYAKSPMRKQVEILRFDLCPLYYSPLDRDILLCSVKQNLHITNKKTQKKG